MGAVVDGSNPLIVRNEEIIALGDISDADFAAVRDHELAEIKRRRARYVGNRSRPHLEGRVVIVIDDGIATGATTRAALRSVRKQRPSELILAVPVAPTRSLQELYGEADAIICLEHHEPFEAVGIYYSDFGQVSDEEVRHVLAEFHVEPSPTGVA
jgi:predicted phosphoribosyltransferase